MASKSTAGGTLPFSVLHAARSYGFACSDPEFGDSQRPWLEGVLVSTTLLALLATALRLCSRWLNQQALWWDDWLAIINMSWMLGLVTMVATAVGLGLGLHERFVNVANVVPLIKIVTAVDLFYIWSLVWSKISLLLLYYRVFRFGYIKRAGYGIGVLVFVWAIVSTILLFSACVPWRAHARGHCSNAGRFRVFNSAATIISDIVILMLPLPQIWSLHALHTAEKAGLTAVFGLGFLVVAIAGYHLSIIARDQSRDSTNAFAPDAGWTVIEVASAVISASFPTVGPAVIEIWRRSRQFINRCLGRAANGQAARPRQDREPRTLNEESGNLGVGSPRQGPDEVVGHFRRLYSKGQDGSAATRLGETGEPLSLIEAQVSGTSNDQSGLRDTAKTVRASEEIALKDTEVSTNYCNEARHKSAKVK